MVDRFFVPLDRSAMRTAGPTVHPLVFLAFGLVALLLTLPAPARADLTELTVTRQNSEAGEDASGKIDQHRCAQTYHARLKRIRDSHIPELEAAYTAAKSRDTSMPGRMIFSTKRPSRRTVEGKLIRRAITNASVRGRRGVLSNDGLNWLTRQIVSNLKTYLNQPFKPYLCTGSRAFLNFVSPHIVKVADLGSAQTAPWEEYQTFVNQALADAWRAMPELATPVWAGDRPNPAVNADLGPIRPTIQPDQTNSSDRAKTTDPAKPAPEEGDLPLLDDRNIPLKVSTPQDIVPAIKALLDRAVARGYLQPNTSSTHKPNPSLGAGAELPDVIVALQEARNILRKNRFTSLIRNQPNPLNAALTKLEAYYYLFPDEKDRLVRLARAMQNILDAIDQASTQTCNCAR